MGIGILQPSNASPYEVTGTKLFDPPVNDSTGVAALKRHPKYPDIILQPQPSEDINDPLNWLRWKKELFFLSVMLSTAGVGTIGPLFIPAFAEMSAEFARPISDITKLNGILVMFLGISSFVGILIGRIYGKRPVLFVTLILDIVGLAWGAKAQSYSSLYGARILQGLGIGAYACMGNALIADVFFLHEQGLRIALWQLSWVVSVNVTPLISARIISASGWRTAFWGVFGYMVFCFAFFLLASPETAYHRTSSAEHKLDAIEDETPTDEKKRDPEANVSTYTLPVRLVNNRFALWSGRVSPDPILISLARPFLVAFTPPVFWCLIAYGFMFTVNIVSGAVYSQVFASPPYSLNVNAVGNISGIGPLIGSLAACLLSGPLADWSARKLSQRNEGYFEPEMYLTLMIPAAAFSLCGLVGWGVSVAHGVKAIVPAVMIGIANFGLTFGYCGTILYSSAVFPSRGGEAFGIIMLCKSAIAFGFTYFVNTWLAAVGPTAFFSTLGGICFALATMGLPFYVFGKRLRLWSSQSALGWTTS